MLRGVALSQWRLQTLSLRYHKNAVRSGGLLCRRMFYSETTIIKPSKGTKSKSLKSTKSRPLANTSEEVLQSKRSTDSSSKMPKLKDLALPKVKSTEGQRLNLLNIQMVSETIHQQIFHKGEDNVIPDSKFTEIKNHLATHDLLNKQTTLEENVNFKLPQMHGSTLEEHFYNLSKELTGSYFKLAQDIAHCTLPPKPALWQYRAGWTKYDYEKKECYQVDFPDSDVLIFDVEVLVTEGDYPTLATAVSPNAWYSWCSSHMTKENEPHDPDKYTGTPEHMIPLETAEGKTHPTDSAWKEKLIIGHNVGFDRSFVKEQYYLKGPKMRFLDTMSIHIAVSGQTSLQRMLYMANKIGSSRKIVSEHKEQSLKRGVIPTMKWMGKSSLNNLNDVYQFHCKGAKPLEKSTRDIFVTGNMVDVRSDFQNLMSYCAGDTVATHAVFKKLWPQFLNRFPHPATLCGMLEMGTAYLPLNKNWSRYIDTADTTYEDYTNKMKSSLIQLASVASKKVKDKSYKKDVWLWDLDWTPKRAKKNSRVPPENDGYPQWYIELFPSKREIEAGASKGPSKLSTQRRVTPKLLNLTWDGFPLHYHKDHGWGYIVPDMQQSVIVEELLHQDEEEADDGDGEPVFPRRALIDVVRKTRPDWLKKSLDAETPEQKLDQVLSSLHEATGEEESAKYWAELNEITKYQNKKGQKEEDERPAPSPHTGPGPYFDVIHGCLFYRLPHKDGATKKVGNPLSKDFLSKIEEGILKSASGSETETILKLSKMTSYWKNNLKRIKGQMAVSLQLEELPEAVVKSDDYEENSFYGAILPRLITAGTVTRRAVEKTWLTASNAYADRIGSELKGMIQCPPGYHFVGADVDSQELWIAAILGDAHFAGIHGCTAFGWMNLQGNKADGTDLHSKTASLVGISRDQAKVFNYGRIYGAGARFAEKLLMQFNSRMTQMQANAKARAMYSATKGKRSNFRTIINEFGNEVNVSEWKGGSESHMFNKLESIARQKEPRTPVLGCMISKALQPANVNEEFMTSRINWVVQSSAVDYLHLMLVTMKWLFQKYDIDGRFCISIHDEVRYLVKSEDRYRAALALQITNLLTRAMFAHQLGMNDLPQSVAFFSAVDIDKCLRKEVTMDCITPSNPKGLREGYNIQPGDALTIHDILDKTSGSLEK